jgi:hypothetical protein
VTDILEEDCKGRVYPVDDFDALNTAQCRLRGAMLALDGLAKGRYAEADSEAIRARAAALYPELETVFVEVRAAFGRLRVRRFGR